MKSLLLDINNFKIVEEDNSATLRFKDNCDYSFQVPNYVPVEFQCVAKVCFILHVYYVELLPEIIAYLNNISIMADVFISTHTETKREEIEQLFKSYSNDGSVVVKVFSNIGRDIAPFIIGFHDIFKEYDYFLHIHTKKTVTYQYGDLWRTHLLENLLGSSEIIQSILWQLSNPDIGIVFPQHFEPIRTFLDWNSDFDCLKELLSKSNINVDQTNLD